MPEHDRPVFDSAMRRVELTGRRTGAYLWQLQRSSAAVDRYREEYTVRSLAEHQRAVQDRHTGYDRGVLDAVQQWRTDEAEWFAVELSRRAPGPTAATSPEEPAQAAPSTSPPSSKT